MKKTSLKDSTLSHQQCSKPFNIKFNSVEELFLSKHKIKKNKKFIFFPEENIEYTYDEFLNEYKKISKLLIKKGFKKKDKISIIFFNESAFLKVYFAALSLGMIVIPINPDLSYDEINYIVKNSSSKLCVYSSKIDFKIKKNNKKYILYDNFLKEKGKSYSEIKKNINLNIKITDTAIIIYTSGTTGNPKGVVLSHKNIIADAFAISKNFKFNNYTRTLCILPMFHNNGQITTFFAPLYTGGSTVITTGKTNLYNFWK